MVNNKRDQASWFYHNLGAHPERRDSQSGVRFAVWAPCAALVRVVGDFNDWDGARGAMIRNKSGIWESFIPKAAIGDFYKYEIHSADGAVFLKADPCAFSAELRPATASRICDLNGYPWQDDNWQKAGNGEPIFRKPVVIYELHAGSWKRKADGSFLSYRELAEELVPYVARLGFTHMEFLPLAEHPLDESWGYQATGYFAVTSRHGSPQDFMYLVDCCHQQGLGVILDWAPGHFCRDAHGLERFDGSTLYEYEDCRKGENRQWGTLNFDYGRPEVQDFLIGNALFWFDVYHIDGLRVDAVANMLYLDYGRQPGEWAPNQYGGRENIEAVELLRKLNETVFAAFPAALMIAEESTAWPLVSRPTYDGGLGFNFKWNMGWMNDMLRYMSTDPLYRRWEHNKLTFSLTYAFSENYILPLSHDEVVHGKKSLLSKMPGDYWQKFANLRLLYGYMISHPGKKLLFMGGEFGQFIEWRDACELDWHLLGYDMHRDLQRFVQELNHYYCQQPALWEQDDSWAGFSWTDCENDQQSIVSFGRYGCDKEKSLLVVCNFTPQTYQGYRIGVRQSGTYQEAINSDSRRYGGSGQVNDQLLHTTSIAWQNQPYSLEITLPPLAVVYLERSVSPINLQEARICSRRIV